MKSINTICLICCMLLSSCSLLEGNRLKHNFYRKTCPNVESIVLAGVKKAQQQEARLPASLLRLHFHDCFVQGCDASILLDDTSTFTGEKTSGPNNGSARGFEVIDQIKTELEKTCSGVVSCADILSIIARDAVVLSGGKAWKVRLGRRDSLTANKTASNLFIPPPTSNVTAVIAKFKAVGLSAKDMVTLSGAHTIGQARCITFSQRLYNQSGTGKPDPTIKKDFLQSLQQLCPQAAAAGSSNFLAPLDFRTPTHFDNRYYLNLQAGKGLLNSDEVLYTTTGFTNRYVRKYGDDQEEFLNRFRRSMIKMGNIKPLTGKKGEIRNNCRFTNSGL
ncbi:hypothetical protein O6H91_02G112500 [Diphasiastrum complanatum]|uniref:Uncharacterized protein n=1 Tax=Diphasiastrum complanatum TaxID=34168 RepID=A0ACC2EJA2_DIPCM|nr:hypothetical protein O6H91_02G112500 [Diphasiastrum complanatum]